MSMINIGGRINLESVSTGLDEDGMTYPMLSNGGYDYGDGIHIDDIEPDGDWMLALDEADSIRVGWFLDARTPLRPRNWRNDNAG
jgi:hypothetical protein